MLSSKVVGVTVDQREQNYHQIKADSYFNGATPVEAIKIFYRNSLSKPMDTYTKMFISKDILFRIPIVIYSTKDFFLMHEINHKIGIFQAAGLIEFWTFKDKEKNENQSSQSALTPKHFLGSFEILFLGCLIGLIVFIFEVYFPFIAKYF